MTVTIPSETTATDSNAAEAQSHTSPRVNLPQPPRIVRPQGLPRASKPADIPAPDHHHLPGWVKRVYGQARPILADLVGGLDGDTRADFMNRIDVLTAGISAGKFSLAWNYPRLIDEGAAIFDKFRQENAELFRQRRNIENARRKASDLLRDAAGRLSGEANSRFVRDLRGATDLESIAAIESEVQAAVSQARSADDKRRDREIDRTRQRILKAVPRSAAAVEPQESWQDVLRRFAESQKDE